VRRAAALIVLLLLGFVASTAIAGRSAVLQLTITTALPPISTTLPVSTTLPTLPVTTTVPKVTTTLPVSTTIPKVTTTLPVSTTLPKVTTTLPLTTALPKVTTAVPKVTTALSVTTTLAKTATSVVQGAATSVVQGTATSVVQRTATNVAGAVQSSASSVGGGTLFQSPQAGSSSTQPSTASASLFTASAGPTAGSAAVTGLRTPRPFVSFTGPKARRAAIIVFRLRHAARVRFTIVQVFPLCRVVGSFTVRGHAGVNRFRFNGRVHGKRLDPGTYQIGLRTKRGRLLRVTIAVFKASGIPHSAVVTARQRNVCGSTAAFATFPGFTLQPPVEGHFATAGATSSRSNTDSSLGVGVTGPQRVIQAIGKNPFALLALGLAVLLLGVAAVPQAATPGGRMGELLVRERPILALSGGAALAVAAIIVALS
jgi:hypothetical protein